MLNQIDLRIKEVQYDWLNYWTSERKLIPAVPEFPKWEIQLTTDVFNSEGKWKCNFYSSTGTLFNSPKLQESDGFKLKGLPIGKDILLFVPFHLFKVEAPKQKWMYVSHSVDFKVIQEKKDEYGFIGKQIDPKPLLNPSKLNWFNNEVWPIGLVVIVTYPYNPASQKSIDIKSFNPKKHSFRFFAAAKMIYDIDTRKGSETETAITNLLKNEKINGASLVDYNYGDFEFYYFVGWTVVVPKYYYKVEIGSPAIPMCSEWHTYLTNKYKSI